MGARRLKSAAQSPPVPAPTSSGWTASSLVATRYDKRVLVYRGAVVLASFDPARARARGWPLLAPGGAAPVRRPAGGLRPTDRGPAGADPASARHRTGASRPAAAARPAVSATR